MKKGRMTFPVILLALIVFLLSVLIAVFAISGCFLHTAYLDPWKKSYQNRFEDPRLKLTAHGLLAANSHNMQPWKIKLDKENSSVFYLYADSSKTTPEVDPHARQMMITQGSFLEYLKIAGEKLGTPVTITLFPEGVYDENNLSASMDTYPVASITLGKAAPKNTPLYDGIFLPDTNRGIYSPTLPSAAAVSLLTDTQEYSGISAYLYQAPDQVQSIGQIAMDAAVIEGNTKRVMKETEEIFRANEYQKNKYRYGFSVEGQGSKGIMKHFLQAAVTLFPSMNSGKAQTDNFMNSTRTSIENTPSYLLLTTKDNSRISQVEAGMLYSSCILKAHNLGLAMQPLSQALEEYTEMISVYEKIHSQYGNGDTIQMLLRVGYPKQSAPLSMRQDVSSLLLK
ncbi:hypothetical protein R2R35_15480 [Anaerocolumna sp. AGMB13020]|uniref:Acg family FMN-binding oxidoreductase n=1 Tax=Anaerocolumna sp. AGMB13020 TaxID=3081750 RepID=UPI0029558A51|nr:hypothetical protein [Anaerocolumna sp. AGMB13020]WOO35197.1 hypothetical protein R2R35_15480 [Anaerocolumna sp. AGMB13020]